jgi:hypothetical protein
MALPTVTVTAITIARISDWLQNGAGGYQTALRHHAHIPPVRAE